jgi:hypothetical protein
MSEQQSSADSEQPVAQYIGTLKDALRAARDELIKHDSEYHHFTDPFVKRLVFDAILSEPALTEPQTVPEGSLLAEFFSHSAIDEAMQDAWNDICSDTGCHPLDIEHGKGRHLTFRANHWANQVAKRLFVRAVKVQLEAAGSAQCQAEIAK